MIGSTYLGKANTLKASNYSEGNSPVVVRDVKDRESKKLEGIHSSLLRVRCRDKKKIGPGRQARNSDSDDSNGIMSDIVGVRNFRPQNCFGQPLVKGTCYYRCNLTTAVKEMNQMKFKDVHYDALKDSPFFFLVKSLKEQNFNILKSISKKSDETIRCVLARFDFVRCGFLIGGVLVKLKRSDVQLIFGVCDGDRPIPTDNSDMDRPEWLVRCFPNCLIVKGGRWKLGKKEMMDKILELLGETDLVSLQDVVRLVHCYLLACVLAPLQNASIPWYIARYVEDVSKISSFNWSGYIIEVLLEQMYQTENMKSGGCALFLLYWLCEHLAIIQARGDSLFPRYLKWDLRELAQELNDDVWDVITSDKIRSSKLVSTDNEKAMILAFVARKEKVSTCVTDVDDCAWTDTSEAEVDMEESDGVSSSTSSSSEGSLDCDSEEEISMSDGSNNSVSVSPPHSIGIMERDVSGILREDGLELLGEATEQSISQSASMLTPERVGDEVEPVTPLTAEFMDNLDTDGVPKGGVRAYCPANGSPVPCITELDSPPYNAFRSELEDKIGELELLVQEKDELIGAVQSEADEYCKQKNAEYIAVISELSKLKLDLGNLELETDTYKANAESTINNVAGECRNIVVECNRLKSDISRLTREKNILTGRLVDYDKIKSLAEASSASKDYVHKLESKFDELALSYANKRVAHEKLEADLAKQRDEYAFIEDGYTKKQGELRTEMNKCKAMIIRKDKELVLLKSDVAMKNLSIKKLEDELRNVRQQLESYVNPTDDQFFDNPQVMEHVECIELLNMATVVIEDMIEDSKDADETIDKQNMLINCLAVVPYANVANNSEQKGVNLEVGGSPVPGISRKKRNKLAISPGSITRTIKARTQWNCRQPRNLGLGFGIDTPIRIDDNEAVPVINVEPRPPFPGLNRRFLAAQRTSNYTLEILKECWNDGGPDFEVWPPGKHRVGSVSTQKCISLLHHESTDDCVVDAWCETLVELLPNEVQDLPKVKPYPARIWGLISTNKDSVHLKRWVDDTMEDALESKVLLFPMNAPADPASTEAHGNHWTLLRLNVTRHEWFFYNSLPNPTSVYADTYVLQSKRIVEYVEEQIKKVYRRTKPTHFILRPDRAVPTPQIVETCRQLDGSEDCAIIVGHLVEMIMRGKFTRKGIFSKIVSGNYRKKMVEWICDPDNALSK